MIIHPTAYVSPKASVNVGTVVLQKAVINSYTVVVTECIINLGAMINHNCVIGKGSHMCLGAIVNKTGQHCFHRNVDVFIEDILGNGYDLSYRLVEIIILRKLTALSEIIN